MLTVKDYVRHQASYCIHCFFLPLIVFPEELWNVKVIIIVSTLVSRCLQDAEEMLKIAISISETLENKVSKEPLSLWLTF